MKNFPSFRSGYLTICSLAIFVLCFATPLHASEKKSEHGAEEKSTSKEESHSEKKDEEKSGEDTEKKSGSEHGDAPAGEEEKPHKGKKKKEGNFSSEDLDLMKQQTLLEYLANPNYQSSEYAVYYFEQKGEPGVTPLLNYLKKHEDNEKKVSAVIYTLGRVGKKASRAVPILTRFLTHENFDIRKTTISALGKIGRASEPAVPEIAKYLESDDAWMRELAYRSLKDINTPQSSSIATQYANKLKLEEERKAKELMNRQKNNSSLPSAKPVTPANAPLATSTDKKPEEK